MSCVNSARVASMNVERQFKLRGIPFTYVSPSDGLQVTSDSGQMQSSLSRSVPALCVQSKDILAGAPAAEAAMPNIRVIPLNWWSKKKAQVCEYHTGLIGPDTDWFDPGGDLCQVEIRATTAR